MAEFCLECFKNLGGDPSMTENDVIMDLDLCEGCNTWKPCVIRVKEKFHYAPSLLQLINELFSFKNKKTNTQSKRE